MSKSKDDEAYARGVKVGQEGNWLSDLGGHSITFSRTQHIFNKGYDYGAQHRTEYRQKRDRLEREAKKSLDTGEDSECSSSYSGFDSTSTSSSAGGLLGFLVLVVLIGSVCSEVGSHSRRAGHSSDAYVQYEPIYSEQISAQRDSNWIQSHNAENWNNLYSEPNGATTSNFWGRLLSTNTGGSLNSRNEVLKQNSLPDCSQLSSNRYHGMPHKSAQIINRSHSARGRANGFVQSYSGGQSEDELRQTVMHDIEWYRKLLLSGEIARFQNGLSTTRVNAWKRGAELGWREAIFLLGETFDIGDPAGANECLRLTRTSAEFGEPLAMLSLYNILITGTGTEKNPTEAIYWLRMACERGEVKAFARLGYEYDKAENIPRNAQLAFQLYQRGADAGDPIAMLSIGMMFAIGDGVPRNRIQAELWLQKSQSLGVSQASAAIKILHQKRLIN